MPKLRERSRAPNMLRAAGRRCAAERLQNPGKRSPQSSRSDPNPQQGSLTQRGL